MKISVIIPAYNAERTIQACIDALKQQQNIEPSAYEIIVVDDGSTDNTAAICEQDAAVCLIRQEDSKGAAAARNRGIQAANYPLICFTDADCQPTPTWLHHLSQPFTDHTVDGCKGIYATNQSALVARFVQIEYEDKYDLLRKQSRIDFVDTYSAAYRREVLVANNGFDERFHFTEDQELSFRLTARGYQFVFQPEAIVYHTHSSSLPTYFHKKFWIGYWKTQTIRRFPERAVKDSHTPQVMKIQIGLIALLVATTAVLPITAVLLPNWLSITAVLWLVLALIFLATTLPFLHKAWGKDKAVALAAPLLLAARALALGLGTVWGFLRPKQGVLEDKPGINGAPFLVKRIMDIVGSLFGLSFMLLFTPIIGLAIKLDSPGPVFFKQQRAGREGKPFTLYKFRSMTVDAEAELETLIDWDMLQEPLFKMPDDPRLTRVGRFLRRWSLDELPQFWNTFKGEMSLVGPRPESLRFVAHYDAGQRKRLMAKPGITGPMQINGRGTLSLDARTALELHYIQNYSVKTDCVILVKTIPAIIRGVGAF